MLLKISRVLGIAFAALFFLLAAAWIFRLTVADFLVGLQGEGFRQRFLAASPAPQIEKHLDKLIADAKLLEAYAVFREGSAGQADASPLLNPMMPTAGGQAAREDKLTLPASLLQKLRDPGDFAELRIDWKQTPLDFSWFGSLKNYDHWAYDQAAPFAPPAGASLNELPILEYSVLSDWAKLNLLKARADGRLAEAIEEVRQLARLVYTHDNTIAALSAVSLVNFTHGILQTPEEKLRHGLPGWEKEGRAAGKRYFYAQGALMDIRIPTPLFEKVNAIATSRCIRVAEGIFYQVTSRGLFANKYPAEIKRIGEAVDRTETQCRPSYLRRAWRDPEYRGWLRINADIQDLPNLSNESPSSRSFIPVASLGDIEKHSRLATELGHILFALSSPSWLRGYEP